MRTRWLLLCALFLPTLALAGPNTVFVRGGGIGKLSESKAVLTHTLDTGWQMWEAPKGTDMLALVGGLREQGAEAYPDVVAHVAVTNPNEAFFSNGSLWHLRNLAEAQVDPEGCFVDDDIDAPEAWDTTTGDSTGVIAVLDTGVEWTHAEFAGNIWSNPGESCTASAS